MIRIATLTATIALACSGIAGARGDDSAALAQREADRAEVATIVMSAVTEVKLCALAMQKSQNAQVQSFCRKASADQARTAIAGMQLAQTLGAPEVKLEPAPDTPELLEMLGHYTGRDFDRELLLAQIEDRENDEHTLRYATEVTTNSSVKHFENSVLPKVELDLNLAENALSDVSESAP